MDGSSAQYLSCKLFHDWSILNYGKILYLLDGYIFAVLIKNNTSLPLLIKFTGVAKKKGPCILVFFQWNFPLMYGAHLQVPKRG